MKKEHPCFNAGVVVALDVVAIFDQGVIVKEIIKTCGEKEMLAEIKENGSQELKDLVKFEFNGGS